MNGIHQLPPVEAGQTMAEAFTAERQNTIEQTLRDISSGRNLRGIGGLRVYRGQGGVTLALRRRPGGGGGGGTSIHNFQVTYAGAASTVANGQIGGITPTLAGGDTLDTVPAPTFTLTGSGTEYVYAKLTVTHTVVEGYVTTSVLDAVDIDAYATEQTDDLTGEYYKLIATVVDGVVVDPQPVRTSLSVTSDDNGTADGKADLSYPTS